MAAERPLRTVDPAALTPAAGGWTAVGWPATGAAPHELVALRLPCRPRPGEVYVREGWQSWSTPAPARVGTGVVRPAAQEPPWLRPPPRPPAPPYRGDEAHHLWRSASATAYVDPGAAAVFVAADDGLLAVREEPADGRHPDVWIAPRAAEPAELATRLALPRPPVAAPVGWSTWDVRGTPGP